MMVANTSGQYLGQGSATSLAQQGVRSVRESEECVTGSYVSSVKTWNSQ